MAKKRVDQIGMLVSEVETLAKRLRLSVRKQAAALPKELNALAGRLRKRAIAAAAQVEKYAHGLRLELEGKPLKTAKRARHAA